MQNQTNNIFEKFQSLKSQELTEDIHWSSSSSSDYENCENKDKSFNVTSRNRNIKRKRKKKVHRNISNLTIAITDVSKDFKANTGSEISPIISRRGDCDPVSPILVPTQRFPLHNHKFSAANSPILTFKSNQKSPIIILKSASSISRPKIRKKLFDIKEEKHVCNLKSIPRDNQTDETNQLDKKDFHPFEDYHNICSEDKNQEKMLSCYKDLVTQQNDRRITENKGIRTEIKCNLQNKSTVDRNTIKAKFDLTRKVRSFFDSHFSSDSISQNSISNSLTPKDSLKMSDEFEILTCTTPINYNNNHLHSSIQEDNNTLSNSSENSLYNDKKSKKTRHKKDGLAYRLNTLLKKETAVLSLWRHERFLAENSNFVIPKGEHTVFRIQKVSFKYGCYLLETMDMNSEEFLILINSNYVFENNIVNGAILKIYETYDILSFNRDFKLIINVSKFECISLRQ